MKKNQIRKTILEHILKEAENDKVPELHAVEAAIGKIYGDIGKLAENFKALKVGSETLQKLMQIKKFLITLQPMDDSKLANLRDTTNVSFDLREEENPDFELNVDSDRTTMDKAVEASDRYSKNIKLQGEGKKYKRNPWKK